MKQLTHFIIRAQLATPRNKCIKCVTLYYIERCDVYLRMTAVIQRRARYIVVYIMRPISSPVPGGPFVRTQETVPNSCGRLHAWCADLSPLVCFFFGFFFAATCGGWAMNWNIALPGDFLPWLRTRKTEARVWRVVVTFAWKGWMLACDIGRTRFEGSAYHLRGMPAIEFSPCYSYSEHSISMFFKSTFEYARLYIIYRHTII